jgi:hypothetical protein
MGHFDTPIGPALVGGECDVSRGHPDTVTKRIGGHPVANAPVAKATACLHHGPGSYRWCAAAPGDHVDRGPPSQAGIADSNTFASSRGADAWGHSVGRRIACPVVC